MNTDACISRLSANAEAIEAMLRGITPDQTRWKPANGGWSMIEVINHLRDEEREDFRQRIDYTLHRTQEDWPPIDPEGWVSARTYQERDPEESLHGFLEERRASIDWLRSLGSIDWSTRHVHQSLGSMTAGDLMASWLAHDLLHIRQLARLHFEYLKQDAHPYTTGYAGEW